MPKLNNEQRKQIIIDYETSETITIKDLAKRYNIHPTSLWGLLHYRNIKIRKNPSLWNRTYSVNENYFDIIDSEDKAYFLGLMYADGNVYKNRVSIGLQKGDKSILNKFKKKIKYKGPLRFEEGKIKKGWGKNKCQDKWILVICNKKLSESLIRLGCIPKKSLILELPSDKQVPNNLIRHFIRGLMDGDGYFSKYFIKNNWIKYQVNLVSTIMLIEKLSQLLKTELNINTYFCKRDKTKNTTTRQMFISGKNQVMKFLDWIYHDSKIHLTRKYNKYKRIRKCKK